MMQPSAWWRGPLIVLLIAGARFCAALADLPAAASMALYDAARTHLKALRQ